MERKRISGVRIKRTNKDKREKEMTESEKDKAAGRGGEKADMLIYSH